MEKNEKLYTEGFNNGYLIAKHEPELSKKLASGNTNEGNEYFDGLISGKQEYEMEKVKGRLKGMAKGKTNDKEKEIEKDRDK